RGRPRRGAAATSGVPRAIVASAGSPVGQRRGKKDAARRSGAGRPLAPDPPGQAAQGLPLELARALARDPEARAHLLERERLLAVQAEAEAQHLPLADRQAR